MCSHHVNDRAKELTVCATMACSHGERACRNCIESVGAQLEDVGKVEKMRAADVLEIFREYAASEDLVAEFGSRKGSAFIRFEADGRCGVVWTPGDRWFAVETDQGSMTYFEEHISSGVMNKLSAPKTYYHPQVGEHPYVTNLEYFYAQF